MSICIELFLICTVRPCISPLFQVRLTRLFTSGFRYNLALWSFGWGIKWTTWGIFMASTEETDEVKQILIFEHVYCIKVLLSIWQILLKIVNECTLMMIEILIQLLLKHSLWPVLSCKHANVKGVSLLNHSCFWWWLCGAWNQFKRYPLHRG